MKIIKPIHSDTLVSTFGPEWAPATFAKFIIELNYIIGTCDLNKSLVLFRGQSDYQYPLDSLFLRNCIQNLFNIEQYFTLNKSIRQTIEFHKLISYLVFLKYGIIANPSKESYEREKLDNIDPWFELSKHWQQYPENDSFIKGSFLLDWTTDYNIGIYFANKYREKRGALWIFDSTESGNILVNKKMKYILDLMKTAEQLEKPKSLPLIFHPNAQTQQIRSKNQKPVYVAQMDFRYDLVDIWEIVPLLVEIH
jgi:hypothetical protein